MRGEIKLIIPSKEAHVLWLRLFFFSLWIKQTKGCTARIGRLQTFQAASHWNKEKRLCLKLLRARRSTPSWLQCFPQHTTPRLTWNHYWEPGHRYRLCNYRVSQRGRRGIDTQQLKLALGFSIYWSLLIAFLLSLSHLLLNTQQQQRMLTGQVSFVLSSQRSLYKWGSRLGAALCSSSHQENKAVKLGNHPKCAGRRTTNAFRDTLIHGVKQHLRSPTPVILPLLQTALCWLSALLSHTGIRLTKHTLTPQLAILV